MGPIVKGALLIALTAAIAWGQEPQGVSMSPPNPVFPSDAQPTDAKLLEAVCPGHVVVGADVACDGGYPVFTGHSPEPFSWQLVSVIRGNFIAPNSDDAVLWMAGCEPPSENFGGTILLTRKPDGWTMLWYKAGVETSRCHKTLVPSTREVLVCVGQYGGQGFVWTDLFLEDLLAPAPVLMATEGEEFFSVFDDINALECDEPLQRGGIEKVEFGTAANVGPLLLVTASLGRKSLTPEEKETCEDRVSAAKPRHEIDIFPATKSYHLEFSYNGRNFKPTPESVATARLFER